MVQVADVAQIWHCCPCGVRPTAAASTQPLAWELPYAADVALKKKEKEKKKKMLCEQVEGIKITYLTEAEESLVL